VKPNFEGEPTTPSVVYFEEDNPDPVVGKEAQNWAKIAPSLVCSTVKRYMGKDDWRFKVWGEQHRAETISALILKKLVNDALEYDEVADRDDVHVVITVPAYFGSAERKATLLAGKIAGLKVEEVIAEPVAAAFSYGLGKMQEPTNLLVYDLGGGTFDVTIVKTDGKSVHTVATDGVRLLGGLDWDSAIVEFVKDAFDEKYGVQLPDDDYELVQRLVNDSEEAKKALSQRQNTMIPVHYKDDSIAAELTREHFEEATAHLLDRTVERTHAALDAAHGKGVDKIDKVLLVGGSSRMPAIKQRIEEEFGIDVVLNDPDQAIAKGAAIIGEMIRTGAYQPATSDDADESTHGLAPVSFVNSKSLGMVVQNFKTKKLFVDYLIPRNSDLPVKQTKTYMTLEDNQRTVDLQVMEQREEEAMEVEQNTLLHSEPLSLPQGLPKDSPLNFAFTLDRGGMLHIFIEEPSSGKNWEVEVNRDGMISEEEVTALRAEVAG